ncbi:hypothetical protein BR93DRAFT_62937 [Coniochaeta sp. PMI_546]|nr:hypothetical protein BR93DRAFT_62937 [Coniochaeta sp. PMI_546]
MITRLVVGYPSSHAEGLPLKFPGRRAGVGWVIRKSQQTTERYVHHLTGAISRPNPSIVAISTEHINHATVTKHANCHWKGAITLLCSVVLLVWHDLGIRLWAAEDSGTHRSTAKPKISCKSVSMSGKDPFILPDVRFGVGAFSCVGHSAIATNTLVYTSCGIAIHMQQAAHRCARRRVVASPIPAVDAIPLGYFCVGKLPHLIGL